MYIIVIDRNLSLLKDYFHKNNYCCTKATLPVVIVDTLTTSEKGPLPDCVWAAICTR